MDDEGLALMEIEEDNRRTGGSQGREMIDEMVRCGMMIHRGPNRVVRRILEEAMEDGTECDGGWGCDGRGT